MKNRIVKILTVALSCLLLIGAIVGISVSAANEPTISIKAKNLAYEGAIQVLYAVDAQNVPANAKVQMYFYNSASDAEPAYVKDAYKDTITISGKEYPVFFSKGIAPKNMRVAIISKAVIVGADGAVIAESDVAEYSAFTYAVNRFTKGATPDQTLLYTSLLNYGAAVQKMLVETKKLTEGDIIDNGGWANAYYGIREDVTLDGKTVATGETKFYKADELVDISADNSYGDGVFASITDKDGNVLTGRAYPKLSVVAEKPGVTVYNANYNVTGYSFNAFDDLCIDGSANDVNTLYAASIEYAAHNAIGVFPKDGTFGNAIDIADGSYQRVAYDSTDSSNKVYLVGANNKAAGNAFAFKMNQVVGGADKYIAQFDLNYHGRTDGGSGDPIYFRIENFDINDAYDIRLAKVSDNSANSYYTFDDIKLNKGQKYTIRYELTPLNRMYYNLEIYVDGELKATVTDATPDANNAKQAYNNVDHFLGVRFFNRSATAYSYELDNVYVGVEGAATTGNGKYADVANYNFNSGAVSDFSFHGNSGSVANGVFNGIQSSIAFKNNKAQTGDKYVYETDFRYERGTLTTGGDANLGWFGLGGADSRDKAKCFAAFSLPYVIADGKISYVKLCRNDGTTAELAKLYPDTWYNIRIEYTPTNTVENEVTTYTGYVQVYINGIAIASYQGKGYNGKTNISNEQFTCAAYEFRGGASNCSNNKYIFDNTYISAENASGPATGKYYSNASYAGVRYDGSTAEGVFKGDALGNIQMLGNVFDMNGPNGSFAFLNAIPEGADAPSEGNVHVFETDILFESAICKNPRETLAWFGMLKADGTVKEDTFLPLYISVEVENGIATGLRIHDYTNNGTASFVISAGEWHNLRFVYTADNVTDADGNVTTYRGNVEAFVDDVLVASYATTGYTNNSDADNEPNNIFAGMQFQFRSEGLSTTTKLNMSLDNVFLGTFTK